MYGCCLIFQRSVEDGKQARHNLNTIMHEKLVIATCLCVIATSNYVNVRQKLKRKKVTCRRCGKKQRYDSEVERSDEEIGHSSQSSSSQYIDGTSDHEDSLELTSEDEDPNDDISEDSTSDEIHTKALETLNKVLEFVEKEKEKNQDVCSTYCRLVEYNLRKLSEEDRSYLMHEYDKLYYNLRMQRLAEEDIVPDLRLTEERQAEDRLDCSLGDQSGLE